MRGRTPLKIAVLSAILAAGSVAVTVSPAQAIRDPCQPTGPCIPAPTPDRLLIRNYYNDWPPSPEGLVGQSWMGCGQPMQSWGVIGTFLQVTTAACG